MTFLQLSYVRMFVLYDYMAIDRGPCTGEKKFRTGEKKSENVIKKKMKM